MGQHQAFARALEEIRKRRSVRTPILGALLDMDDDKVDALLAPARVDGRLICCNVEAGGKKVIEYRFSVAGGGHVTAFIPSGPRAKPVDPVKALLKQWGTSTATGQVSAGPNKTPARTEPAALAPVATNPEENTMTIRKKVEAMLRQHGPMSVRDMRDHGLKDATLSQHCGDLADRGELQRLGGGKRSTVYGLPGQKITDKAAEPVNGSAYGPTLVNLRARRVALVAEVAKLDQAIAAVAALA